MSDLEFAENAYVAAYTKWQSGKWTNDDNPSLRWRLIDGPKLWQAFCKVADVLVRLKEEDLAH